MSQNLAGDYSFSWSEGDADTKEMPKATLAQHPQALPPPRLG